MCTDSIHLQYEHGSSNQTMVEKFIWGNVKGCNLLLLLFCSFGVFHFALQCHTIWSDVMWCDAMQCNAKKKHCYLFIIIFFSRQFYSFSCLKYWLSFAFDMDDFFEEILCHHRAWCFVSRELALQFNYFASWLFLFIYFVCNKNIIFIYLLKSSCWLLCLYSLLSIWTSIDAFSRAMLTCSKYEKWWRKKMVGLHTVNLWY